MRTELFEGTRAFRQFRAGFNLRSQRWLHEARRRFGLCVLDYQVTRNHVHLLVLDRRGDEIAAGLQLIAGRTAQAFNQRKRRRGAFWEDRYHATAVDTGEHLARCVVYVDMNMVRAGVVRHPREWVEAGYHEIQQPRGAYRIVDRAALSGLLGIPMEGLAGAHAEWIETALASGDREREAKWSESVAVGQRAFVEKVKRELAGRARYRRIAEDDGTSVLRDGADEYATIPGSKWAA